MHPDEEIDSCRRLYDKYMAMFRLENDKNKDICINRTQGEDFSLLIEVVQSKRSSVKLFEGVDPKMSTISINSSIPVGTGMAQSKFAGKPKILIANYDATNSSCFTMSNASTPD